MSAHDEVLRLEDPPLLQGRGTFIDGLRLPELDGALHAVFVRSTEPHARITGIDASDALGLPGVVGVFTGEDVRHEIWPLPPRLPMMHQAMVRPMLAVDVVRFVGEPVAVVVARSRYEAVDAAEAVMVDYDRLPAVVDLDEALAGAVLVHEHAGTNVSYAWTGAPFEGDPFAGCDVVVELEERHPRLNPAPMEPRAGAALWGADGRCTSWVCSQRPAGAKHVIEHALGLAPGTVRAVAPDVGGGFGAKGGYGCYPEDVVLAWAARRLRRAVRWTETRSEAMVAMGHGRASRHRLRLGGRRDGTVLAYEAVALQDSGAYPSMGTFITGNLRNSGTGVYAIPAAHVAGTSVTTNTTPTVAFRGAGRPEAACDIERALDRFAAEIGLDPVEVRLRNVVPADAFPYRSAVGATYDSGDYAEAIRRCVAAADYVARRAEQAERRACGDRIRLGIGVSCTTEVTGGGDETSTCTVHPDGRVDVVVGTSPHGQGHETAFTELVVAELGVAREAVRILHGDTDLAPTGGGTIGSRSAQLGGAATQGAVRAAVDAAREKAAALLEADVADVVFDRAGGGSFHVAGTPARSLGWADLGGVDATASFSSAGTYAFGACIAVVTLDVDTGEVRCRELTSVDDAGTILHHASADGQVHGGLGLAVGAALYEEMVYDADGVPRTANFADYPVVSATEVPSLRTLEMVTPSPLNPLGAKGIGESGTVVGTPALQAAVLDALAEFGVTHLDMPYTPERVWRALR